MSQALERMSPAWEKHLIEQQALCLEFATFLNDAKKSYLDGEVDHQSMLVTIKPGAFVLFENDEEEQGFYETPFGYHFASNFALTAFSRTFDDDANYAVELTDQYGFRFIVVTHPDGWESGVTVDKD